MIPIHFIIVSTIILLFLCADYDFHLIQTFFAMQVSNTRNLISKT